VSGLHGRVDVGLRSRSNPGELFLGGRVDDHDAITGLDWIHPPAIDVELGFVTHAIFSL
jgi:hypothetical protein